MYRKCISITVFLCLLVMGRSAYGEFGTVGHDGAETRYQDNWHSTAATEPAVQPLDPNWHRRDNWGAEKNSNRPPGSGGGPYWPSKRPPDKDVWAVIEAKLPEPNIAGGSAVCSRLSIHPWKVTEAPPYTGFALTVEANETNPVDFNCGIQIGLADKNADYVSPEQGYAVLNVHGGTMYTSNLYLTSLPPTTVYQTGLYIGGGPPPLCNGSNYGTVNMYGGSIIVPGIKINYGDVNLYGGLLYQTVDDTTNLIISDSHAMNKINIEGGELRLKGDRRVQVEDFRKADRICPCWNRGILYVDYNGTDTNVTAECTPGSAWSPTPADGAERIVLDPTLTWKPGDWVQADACDGGTHAVYFGPNEVNVTEANEVNQMGVYKGRQDPCSYTPTAPLEAGTTYYWRIDEYNDTDLNMWTGQVWSFKTRGGDAIDPVPADGAVGLHIPLQLSWTPGVFVADTNGHEVYFGTSEVNVANDANDNHLGTYQGVQDSNVFLLSKLDYNLVPDTTYYWRIAEINKLNPKGPWEGVTWSFTNTNYFIIDDFESYGSDEALLARWDIGDDYESCAYKYGAGQIGWVYSAENGTMQFDYDNQSGSTYCPSCRFSEVRFDANGADWTGGGALPDNDKARILAISYIGEPGNSLDNPSDPNYDKMYVAIVDMAGHLGTIIKNSDEAQRTSSWEQWEVKLTDLNSPDVDLKDVNYLYLGFGIRCSAGDNGGTGTVRFDDIRLYQRHCVPEYAPGDLTGDCKVNLDDVNVLAGEWLEGQTTVTPKEPCNIDPNLKLWYKFDEIAGEVVTDSSGNNYHGDINSDAGSGWWDAGGYDGGCLNVDYTLAFDYNTYVDACTAALGFVDTNNALTFSVWVDEDIYSPIEGFPRLVSVFQDTNPETSYDDESEVVEIECPAPRSLEIGEGPLVRYIPGSTEVSERAVSQQMEWSDFGGGWNHYAFVRDTDDNYIRIYHNGGLVAEATNTTTPMFNTPIEVFHIGYCGKSDTDTKWTGKIDDFKVYDYALSQAEVAWLAGFRSNPSYVPVPFNNKANLKSSTPERVNFGDFAVLAQKWLSEQLWP